MLGGNHIPRLLKTRRVLTATRLPNARGYFGIFRQTGILMAVISVGYPGTFVTGCSFPVNMDAAMIILLLEVRSRTSTASRNQPAPRKICIPSKFKLVALTKCQHYFTKRTANPVLLTRRHGGYRENDSGAWKRHHQTLTPPRYHSARGRADGRASG